MENNKEGEGIISRIINDDNSAYTPSTSPITQKQFEEMLYVTMGKTPKDYFYIGTQAGMFRRDQWGNWAARVNENKIDEDYDDTKVFYKPCLSPFLDENTLKTRSKIIFIKDPK